VCQNTLIASYKDAKDGIAIRHTGNIKDKVEEARRALGLALDFYKDFEQDALKMVNTPMSDDSARGYFTKLLGIKDEEDISTQADNARGKLQYLFKNGKGNSVDGVRNTVWAGYNAVTEYSDYFKTTRGDRVHSLLFGSGADLKKKAYQEALVLVA
jgi:hypothetical protein